MSKKYIIPFLCFFSFTIIHGQKLEKKEERFENGFTNPGTVTYYYYQVPGSSRGVKQGYFKYNLKESNEVYRFSHYISGSYEKGLKTGDWSFKMTMKNYELPGETGYITGNMELEAGYLDGMPNGEWRYTYTMKKREIEKMDNGRIDWSPYFDEREYSLRFSFMKGRLVDTFYLDNNHSTFVVGKFDAYGFFHEDWYAYQDGNEQRTTYVHGRTMKKEEKDKATGDYKTIQVLTNDMEAKFHEIITAKVKSYSTLAALTYTLDTTSVLSNTGHVITAALSEMIFHNRYFMFKKLDGDIIDFAQLDGGKEVQVVNQVSVFQQEQLDRMQDLITEMNRVTAEAGNLKEIKEKFTHFDQSMVDGMDIFCKKSEKIYCLASGIVSKQKVNEGMVYANKKCEGMIRLMEKMPGFASENEALAYYLKKVEANHATVLRNFEEVKKE